MVPGLSSPKEAASFKILKPDAEPWGQLSVGTSLGDSGIHFVCGLGMKEADSTIHFRSLTAECPSLRPEQGIHRDLLCPFSDPYQEPGGIHSSLLVVIDSTSCLWTTQRGLETHYECSPFPALRQLPTQKRERTSDLFYR